jgi:NAD(P)-dependent dehydrogenase (short-subunit alcohol dehydrogenase family)
MLSRVPVVLVTGATGGIGLHIARQLADQGWMVLVGARDAARGTEAAAQLGGRPLLRLTFPADHRRHGVTPQRNDCSAGRIDISCHKYQLRVNSKDVDGVSNSTERARHPTRRARAARLIP